MAQTQDIADVVAAVESGGDASPLDAIRFEPAWLPRPKAVNLIPTVQRLHNCNTGTAHMLASCSWGRFQIMGFNLWGDACRMDCPYSRFIGSEELQRAAFRSFCAYHHVDFSPAQLVSDGAARVSFATVYNGPGNTLDYAQRLRVAALKIVGA